MCFAGIAYIPPKPTRPQGSYWLRQKLDVQNLTYALEPNACNDTSNTLPPTGALKLMDNSEQKDQEVLSPGDIQTLVK